MVKAYDVAVKNLIQVFVPNIPVLGLQNEDNTDNSESVISQAAQQSTEDKMGYPVISVFRNPDIEISDGSQTKRQSSYQGYPWYDKDKNLVCSLVSMRANLVYTVDVFDTTRASAEEIATRLYFRLRNNPQIDTSFEFTDFKYTAKCSADIQLEPNITNVRLNDKTKSQLYKIRFRFKLANANLYDIIDRDPIKKISYKISVQLDSSDVVVEGDTHEIEINKA